MSVVELTSIQVNGLVQSGKWLSYFILLGAGLSLTVSIMRINGVGTFKLGQLEFSLSRFVFVALALTIVHAFLTWIFVQRVGVIEVLDKSSRSLAWNTLVNSEAFVFFNMHPRFLDAAPWPLGNAYVAQAVDTAFWFQLASSMLLVVAVVVTLPVSSNQPASDVQFIDEQPPAKAIQYVNQLHDWLRPLGPWADCLAVGCALAAANWIIGSQWAIAASGLAA